MNGRFKSHREYEVLDLLRADPRMSIQELCDATGIRAKSHVHGLLKKLEDAGLIQRVPNRARSITLVGGRRPKVKAKVAKYSEAKVAKYSEANYEKKRAAGRKGRGKGALLSKAEKILSESKRIDLVVARAKEREAAGGFDVLHDHRRAFSRRVHATKIG